MPAAGQRCAKSVVVGRGCEIGNPPLSLIGAPAPEDAGNRGGDLTASFFSPISDHLLKLLGQNDRHRRSLVAGRRGRAWETRPDHLFGGGVSHRERFGEENDDVGPDLLLHC